MSIILLLVATVVANAVPARSVTLLGHGRGGVGHAVTVRSRQFGHVVLLLPLHASVLKPDLDLSLGEREGVRDLDATTPRQVAVEMELLLEFKSLVASVRLTRSFLLETEIYNIIHPSNHQREMLNEAKISRPRPRPES